MRAGTKIRRLTAAVLVFVIGASMVVTSVKTTVQAQAKPVLTMSQARALALRNSAKIEQLESKLEAKQVSKEQAVKTIAMKKANMASFRWSPLLSFKFPEKPDLAESYEFQFKPISIQYEIDTIKHQLKDQVFAIYESVNTIYLDIVMLEKQIDLDTQKVEQLDRAISKSEKKLLIGQASQDDIDTMVANRKSLNSKISTNSTNLLKKKQKLAKLTDNNDVLTKYRFESPFVETTIDRSKLEYLIQYTLDHDETYYEACIAETSANVALRTYYDLMSQQYGSSSMSLISGYVYQSLNGEKVNSRAFKTSYKQFLKKIDEPWNGYKRILFIKIPKLWFKGEIDGSRYVEDEPYALYESTLEYQTARLEKEAAADELRTSVTDAFDNYISVRNSYKMSLETLDTAEKQLAKDLVLNKQGLMTYEEYKSSLDNYENLQNEMFEAMQLYSQTLYEFDRLTCGAITALLGEGGASTSSGDYGESTSSEDYEASTSSGDYGESNFEKETAEGGKYYFSSIIQNQEFRLTIFFPEDFDVKITHYELWCDGVQIGDRTLISDALRHLTLAKQSVEKAVLRFYNDGKFVDECEIDPEKTSGPITLTKGYTLKNDSVQTIGTYTSKQNETTGMIELTLNPDESEGISYYLIRNQVGGTYLYTQEPISISEPFKYLSVLDKNMVSVVIECYDSNKQLKYNASFDPESATLLRMQEEE